MSVDASRWTHEQLAAEPRPSAGGLSHRARAVLLVLAGDANADTGEAFTSATTIATITGHSERNVRHVLTELAAWMPRRRRPGKSDVWVFPPGAAPRSPATGVTVLDLSTPRSPATGLDLSTPRSPRVATPVAGDRRRVLRDTGISTRRDPTRAAPRWGRVSNDQLARFRDVIDQAADDEHRRAAGDDR